MKAVFAKPGVQALGLMVLSAAVMCLPVVFPQSENPGFLAWYEFLGSFHPLFLHLPIGILTLVVALELWAKVRGQKADLLFPLILNALSALAAAVFGFIWYLTGSWEGETIENHLWKGLAFAALALWLPWIYHHLKVRAVASYYIGLVVLVGVMFSAAHDGGTMSHGDPLAKAPWLQEEEKALSEAVLYHDVVVPILEEKCYTCHSESKRKGGLRLDSIALMVEGGDNDTALVPGEIHNSPLLTSIHLPEEDDMHMPPKEKPQITARELAILEHWVRLGASDSLKVADIPSTDPLLAVLESADQVEGTGTVEAVEVQAQDSPLFAKVVAFNAQFGNSLSWMGHRSQTLRFSLESMRGKESAEIYAALAAFAGAIEVLDLAYAQHGARAMELAVSCSQLKSLDLGASALSDTEVVQYAAGLPSTLEQLVLHSTGVSDAALPALAKLGHLQRLYLWNAPLSEKAVASLRRQLPECAIDFPALPKSKGSRYSGEMKVTTSSSYGDTAKHLPGFTAMEGTQQPFTVHTNADKGAWVMLELQQEIQLSHVIINNRPELQERANGLRLELSRDAKSWTEVEMPNYNQAPKVWEIELDHPARYLRLKLPDSQPQYLHLQHISIYHKQ